MTELMGRGHHDVASNPSMYTEMWDTYMNTGKNVCILAPRQSGKTHALRQKFLNTPNSVYVSLNGHTARDTRNWCSRQNNRRPDLNLNSDIVTPSGDLLHSRTVDNIFFDEVGFWRVDFGDIMRNVWPVWAANRNRGQIIAVTTPNRAGQLFDYERYFNNIVRLPYDWIENHQQETPILRDYFEGDLFEI